MATAARNAARYPSPWCRASARRPPACSGATARLRVALVAAADIGQDVGLVGRLALRRGVRARGGAARTSGVAVTKIFTSASGQITVPMSRPSSTAPGGCAAKSRWKSNSAARTAGIAETIEAASPIAWP